MSSSACGPAQGTAAWHAERRRLVTATDVATILGANPYETADALLRRKQRDDDADRREESPAMAWGNAFEAIAAQVYDRKHPVRGRVMEQPPLLYHPTRPFLAASPDRVVTEPEAATPYLLEIKCPYRGALLEPVSEAHRLQVRHQLEVTGLEHGVLWECDFGIHEDQAQAAADDTHPIQGYDATTGRHWFLRASRRTRICWDATGYRRRILPRLCRFHGRLMHGTGGRDARTPPGTRLGKRKREAATPAAPSPAPSLAVVRNYLQQDTLLDWLDCHGAVHGYEREPPGAFARLLFAQHRKLVRSLVDQHAGAVTQCHGDAAATRVALDSSRRRQDRPLIVHPRLRCERLGVDVCPTLLVWDTDARAYEVRQVVYKKLHLLRDGVHLGLGRSQVNAQITAYWATEALRERGVAVVDVPRVVGSAGSGAVDVEALRRAYETRWGEALQWYGTVRAAAYAAATPGDAAHPLLTPNMCNARVGGWDRTRTGIARDIGDPTQVWQVRPRHRSNARALGVADIRDPACTADALGVGPRFRTGTTSRAGAVDTKATVAALLDQGRSDAVRSPRRWKGLVDHLRSCDVYLDLEFVNDVLFDSPHLSMIYMVGVGYRCPRSGTWHAQEFVADALTRSAEARMLRDFLAWVAARPEPPRFVHWSPAEPSQLRRACARHGLVAPAATTYLDLLDVFVRTPLTVKGCTTFKLKHVTRALHAHGLIRTSYDASDCDNGADAMVLCWQHYGLVSPGVDFEVQPIMTISTYNRVDTRVLADIHDLF